MNKFVTLCQFSRSLDILMKEFGDAEVLSLGAVTGIVKGLYNPYEITLKRPRHKEPVKVYIERYDSEFNNKSRLQLSNRDCAGIVK